MRHLLRFSTILLLGATFALVGCNDTHVARCNDLLGGQNATIGNLGGTLRCDPSYDSDEPATAIQVDQWNDPSGPIVWLWQARLDDPNLRLWAWIGAGEIAARQRGMVPSSYTAGVPPTVQVWAARWAWCHEQILGVGTSGYGQPAEGCANYL